MKVLTWNVNGRVGDAAQRQIDAVLDRAPDVVALQEVTQGSYDAWREALSSAKYVVLSTIDLVTADYPVWETGKRPFPRGRPRRRFRRRCANLTAAKHRIEALPGLTFAHHPELAFPEKYLAAAVTIDGRAMRVHNAHLPPGVSMGLIKVYAFEAIRRRVDEDLGHPVVLCGDFNAPEGETAAGPRYKDRTHDWPGLNPQWLDAESSIIEHPRLRDAYRRLHPTGPFPVSHLTGHRVPRVRRRYDYVFGSPELVPTHCEYMTEWLEKDWSDHAAVVATLAWSDG